MLLIDAAEDAPTLWMVLTAREHLTRGDTYRALEHLRRAARRRWPDVAWFVQVEFQRRGALHLNLLVKGVPVEELDAFRTLIAGLWCERVDALPVGQWAGAVNDAGGVARYLAKTLAHGLKSEQAPPLGWRGHRTSQTRNYFRCGARVARARAVESRVRQRAVYACRAAGGSAHDAELAAHEALRQRASSVWALVSDRGARLSATAYRPRRMFRIPRASGGLGTPNMCMVGTGRQLSLVTRTDARARSQVAWRCLAARAIGGSRPNVCRT